MPRIEHAGRQHAKEELLGIASDILLHHAHGIRRRPAAGKADLDILQHDILDPVPGNSGDHDPLAIALIARDRRPDIPDPDIPQDADRGPFRRHPLAVNLLCRLVICPATVAQTDKDRAANLIHRDIGNLHVLQPPAIHHQQLDRPHRAVVELAIGHLHVHKPTPRRCPQLVRRRVAADRAAPHHDVRTHLRGRALRTDRIVSRIDHAVLNQHIHTAIQINAVVVNVVVLAIDPDAIETHIPARDQMQAPGSRISEGQILEGNIFTLNKPHQHRPLAEHIAGLFRESLLCAPRIHKAFTCKPDILCLVRVDQAFVKGRCLNRTDNILRIISQAGASQQHRFFINMQNHVILHPNCPNHKTAGRNNDLPATRCGTGVNRLLDGRRVHRHTITHCSEVKNVQDCCCRTDRVCHFSCIGRKCTDDNHQRHRHNHGN